MVFRLYILMMLIFLTTGPVSAATHYWIHPGGGVFHMALNWNPSEVPNSNDIAKFNQDSTYMVEIWEDVTNSQAQFAGGSVTLRIAPEITYSVTGTTFVGYGNNSQLLLTGGGVIHNQGNVRVGDAGVGIATIDDGSLFCDTAMTIGTDFNGELYVNADGVVETQLLWFWSRSNNSGTLDLNAGIITASDFQLGISGIASGQVRNGAELITDTAILGGEVGSEVTFTVEGPGTSWTNTNNLTVGDEGSAELTISDSATVSTENGYIGKNGTSPWPFRAFVNVIGGLWEIDNNLIIGTDNGYLGGWLFLNSGSVQANNTIQMTNSILEMTGGNLTTGQLIAQNSEIEWSGGAMSITGSNGLVLGDNGPFTLSSGSVLDITPGKNLVVTHAMTIESGYELKLNGGFFFSGILSLDDGLVTAPSGIDLEFTGGLTGHGEINGSVEGSSTKTITADGPLEMGNPASTTGFEIEGIMTVGSHSVILHDSNRAHLGISTILDTGGQLSAANGVRLESGDVLDANGAASITGEMYTDGTINGPALAGEYLVFNDGVLGTGTFTGNIEYQQGYNPASSPIQITFDGNLQLTETAEVTMELNGADPGTGHDQLSISVEFIQDGTLVVQLMTGYSPVNNDVFQLFNCGSISGAFDTFDLPVLDPGLGWDTSDLAVTGVIRVSPCVHHGDVNLDGSVTAGDAQLAFSIVLGVYSPSYEEECAADCNNDGSVTSADAQGIFGTALGTDSCTDPV